MEPRRCGPPFWSSLNTITRIEGDRRHPGATITARADLLCRLIASFERIGVRFLEDGIVLQKARGADRLSREQTREELVA
jgi:hypothetical protein